MSFGDALKTLRDELGLSQASLAAEIGSTQRHVSFLETGRSQPSRAMLLRIATSLTLSTAQRAALFAVSGFRSPYPARDLADPEIAAALDMIDARILANWPFPAFALAPDWTVLRHNRPAGQFLAPFLAGPAGGANLLELVLSEPFRGLIDNWDEMSAGLYFRLQTAARHSPRLALAIERARATGCFDHIAATLTRQADVPVYVPIRMTLPGGIRMNLSSLIGQLASVHDALAEGFEIEMVVPLDSASEAALRSVFG